MGIDINFHWQEFRYSRHGHTVPVRADEASSGSHLKATDFNCEIFGAPSSTLENILPGHTD